MSQSVRCERSLYIIRSPEAHDLRMKTSESHKRNKDFMDLVKSKVFNEDVIRSLNSSNEQYLIVDFKYNGVWFVRHGKQAGKFVLLTPSEYCSSLSGGNHTIGSSESLGSPLRRKPTCHYEDYRMHNDGVLSQESFSSMDSEIEFLATHNGFGEDSVSLRGSFRSMLNIFKKHKLRTARDYAMDSRYAQAIKIHTMLAYSLACLLIPLCLANYHLAFALGFPITMVLSTIGTKSAIWYAILNVVELGIMWSLGVVLYGTYVEYDFKYALNFTQELYGIIDPLTFEIICYGCGAASFAISAAMSIQLASQRCTLIA